jgi:hypothetical protein
MRQIIAIAAASLILVPAAAEAQSTASTYSYGTYNPVQAAINRDAMNAAVIRQATGKKTAGTIRRTTTVRHRR